VNLYIAVKCTVVEIAVGETSKSVILRQTWENLFERNIHHKLNLYDNKGDSKLVDFNLLLKTVAWSYALFCKFTKR